MTTFKCSKRKLLLSYIDGGSTVEALSTILKENYQLSEDNLCFTISDIQRHIIPSFNKRWIQASREKDAFLSKNSDWLDSEYCVPLPNSEEAITESTPSTSFEKRGRPCCLMEIRQNPAKKEKNTMLLKEYGFEHIFNTYLQALRSIGKEAESKFVESLRIADKDKKNLIS